MAELGENIVRRIAPFGVTVSTGIIQTCANENFILHDVAICNYLDRLLEGEMAKAATGDGTNRGELAARLDQLEKEANQVKMPVAYASMLYELRNHIDLVREGLTKDADSVAEGIIARSE